MPADTDVYADVQIESDRCHVCEKEEANICPVTWNMKCVQPTVSPPCSSRSSLSLFLFALLSIFCNGMCQIMVCMRVCVYMGVCAIYERVFMCLCVCVACVVCVCATVCSWHTGNVVLTAFVCLSLWLANCSLVVCLQEIYKWGYAISWRGSLHKYSNWSRNKRAT